MRHTFRVFPGGTPFYTSELSRGDTSDAFVRAHTHAAKCTAESKLPHFVTRDDTGRHQYGFGSPLAPSLLKVMANGFSSYFDFSCTTWLPLEEEKVEEKNSEKIEA